MQELHGVLTHFLRTNCVKITTKKVEAGVMYGTTISNSQRAKQTLFLS